MTNPTNPTTPTTPAECRAEQERVLAQATDAVNEMLKGKLYQHVKTGGVYLEYGRGDHVFDKKPGDKLFSGIMGAPLIEATDDIPAGEMFVRYRNVLTGEGWARPARLFDDGRFIPLTLAPAALLAAHAEALEREARMAAECDMYRVTLQNLHQAAANMLTGIEVNNRLHPDAPARRKDIAGPVVTSLRAAVLSARVALSPNPPTGYALPPAQAPASAEGGAE